MAINFNTPACQKKTNVKKFGLCDIGTDLHARISILNEEKNFWLAKVLNQQSKEVTCIALDNCIQRKSSSDISLCDFMLICDEIIYFIELKEIRKNRKTKAFNQIESTIKQYIKFESIKFYTFKKRKAYYANKKNQQFQVIESELKNKFRHKYKTQIDASYTIKIK